VLREMKIVQVLLLTKGLISYSLSGNSVASWGGVCYAAAFPDSCFGVASSLTLDLQGCLLSP
jgi:hypothetical protein